MVPEELAHTIIHGVEGKLMRFVRLYVKARFCFTVTVVDLKRMRQEALSRFHRDSSADR
jgi:hypothetical protein